MLQFVLEGRGGREGRGREGGEGGGEREGREGEGGKREERRVRRESNQGCYKLLLCRLCERRVRVLASESAQLTALNNHIQMGKAWNEAIP